MDLIDRQAVLAMLDDIVMEVLDGDGFQYKKWSEYIEGLPSAQLELPAQFMSDDCISRSELYKQVCDAEELARKRVLDTPSDSPFPNRLNPAYTRYSAQLDERTRFKHMIADARSVQPQRIRGRWVEVTDGIYIWKVCDQCGEKPLWNEWRTDRYESNYCPNCGADMRGGEQDDR